MSNEPTKESEKESTDVSADVAQLRGRPEYYDKWAQFNKEQTAQEEQDEQQEEEKKKEELKKAPQSEHQKKDLAAREKARKKAETIKKLQKEMEQKVLIEGEEKKGRRIVNRQDPLFAKVAEGKTATLTIKRSSGCHYVIDGLELSKLFVERCRDITVEITNSTRIVVEHIEMTRCNDSKLELHSSVATVQADLCSNLHIHFEAKVYQPEHSQVVHAHCRDLKVTIGDNYTHTHGDTSQGPVEVEDSLVQYVTHIHSGRLRTERVHRPQGHQGRPVTIRDLRQEHVMLQLAVRQAEEKGDQLALAVVSSQLQQKETALKEAIANEEGHVDMKALLERTSAKKAQGNTSFGERDYPQAVLHYSEAVLELQRALEHVQQHTEAKALLGVTLSNRAACFLKMGDHDNAIEDAKRAVNIDEKNVKAYFRWGMSLHAKEQYRDALPILAKALELEPNNKTTLQAIRFSERKLAMQARGQRR